MVTICTASLTLTNSTFYPHSVFMCFAWIWEQTAIISLYNINWLVFITETECLLCGTDWVFIYNSTFCPHSVFMCFVWIWEQTAIISLYSINWLVCITETECLLRGTDWICTHIQVKLFTAHIKTWSAHTRRMSASIRWLILQNSRQPMAERWLLTDIKTITWRYRYYTIVYWRYG